MGLLLAQCFGRRARCLSLPGPARSYAFPLSDNVGKFFTAQFGMPDLGGTVSGYDGSAEGQRVRVLLRTAAS